MKNLVVMICLGCLLLTALPGQTETVWSKDEWEQVISCLDSAEFSPVPASRRMLMKQSQLYLANPAEQKSGWLNVALISTDAQDMQQNFGRSKALLICRINQQTGEVRLLSLPEYMNVQIAGLPDEIQLKYANCFGGPLLALDTVNREFGLSVNRYCAVNIDSFSGIIDSMGGVTLTLTAEESEALGLEQGTQTLSGEDAVRYLKLGQQWDGIRNLLEALLRQIASNGMLRTALNLIDTMLQMIDTNLTMDEVITLAVALIDQREMKGIESYRLEADAEGNVDEAARTACLNFLYGGAAAQ